MNKKRNEKSLIFLIVLFSIMALVILVIGWAVLSSEKPMLAPGDVAIELIGFSDGIGWELVSPATEAPANGNNGTGSTTYKINVLTEGTVDLSIKASGNLIDQESGASIGLSNEKFSFSTTDPTVSGAIKHSLSTTDYVFLEDFSGGTIYVKFFLSVPSGQSPGDYVNNVEIKAIDTTPVDTSLPDAPTGLETNGISHNLVNLLWQDNSDNEHGFIIERSKIGPSSGFVQIGQTGPNHQTFTDTPVMPNTNYWYRVRAFNSLGGSGNSNAASAMTDNAVLQISLGNEEIVMSGTAEWVDGIAPEKCELMDLPDTSASAIRDANGQIVLFAANSPHNYIMRGTNFDNLQRICSPVALIEEDNSFANTFKNNEWVSKAYTVNGQRVYGFVHNEYHDPFAASSPPCTEGLKAPGNPCWYNAISLAISDDGGSTFSRANSPMHLVAPSNDTWNATQFLRPGTTNQFIPPLYGQFQPSNIVRHSDGYYYLMFMSIRPSASSSYFDRGSCIARTNNLDDPSSWRAWDGNSFSIEMKNPYTTPMGESIPPCAFVEHTDLSTLSESVVYNTYLGSYISVGAYRILDSGQPSGDLCGFFFSLSEDLLDWSPKQLMMQSPLEFCTGKVTQMINSVNVTLSTAYPGIIDQNHPENYASSRSFEYADEDFHLYFMKKYASNFFEPGIPPSQQNPFQANRNLMRVPVTIQWVPV